MRKNVVIILSIVAIIFLFKFILLNKNSPIVSLVCKKTAGYGCYLDRCGECKNNGEAATPLPPIQYRELLGDGCRVGLSADIISGGYVCKKVNDRCRLSKTWRTTACEILLGTYTEMKENEKRGRQKAIYVDDFGK